MGCGLSLKSKIFQCIGIRRVAYSPHAAMCVIRLSLNFFFGG
ncbi:hypothetical protein PARMER_04272, partial [Parabacteroides merdae ATCC 43184]